MQTISIAEFIKQCGMKRIEMRKIMKNVKKALIIGILALYVCMQSACGTNNDQNPDDMAGGTSSMESTGGMTDNQPNNNIIDDAGNAVGDVINDIGDGIKDITDDATGNQNQNTGSTNTMNTRD